MRIDTLRGAAVRRDLASVSSAEEFFEELGICRARSTARVGHEGADPWFVLRLYQDLRTRG